MARNKVMKDGIDVLLIETTHACTTWTRTCAWTCKQYWNHNMHSQTMVECDWWIRGLYTHQGLSSRFMWCFLWISHAPMHKSGSSRDDSWWLLLDSNWYMHLVHHMLHYCDWAMSLTPMPSSALFRQCFNVLLVWPMYTFMQAPQKSRYNTPTCCCRGVQSFNLTNVCPSLQYGQKWGQLHTSRWSLTGVGCKGGL